MKTIKAFFIVSILFFSTSVIFAQNDTKLYLRDALRSHMDNRLSKTSNNSVLDHNSGLFRYEGSNVILADSSLIVREPIQPQINDWVPSSRLPSYHHDRFYPEDPTKKYFDEKMIAPLPKNQKAPSDNMDKGVPIPNFPNWRIEKLKNIGGKL